MTNDTRSLVDRLVLNAVQREAVVYNGGPQLVFAGAGTGKTRVLTAKIAWLIEQGMHPSRIVAATFTNKAAGEMRERVGAFTGGLAVSLWIGTFHSLCARILRTECASVGYQPGFSIYDTADQATLMRKTLATLGIDERSITPRAALSKISGFKSNRRAPEDIRKDASGFYEQEYARIYLLYQQMLRERQAMDFDDLLMLCATLFRDNSAIRDKYINRFEYVLVDEYQDTSETQMYLVKMLAKRHNRIFAVGDDDQSIYGWRGACIENILQFERHFTGTKTFKLEQNYRSTSAILEFANSAIKGNKNRAVKKLWTDSGKGEKVVVRRYRDDRQEANDIVAEITTLCSGNAKGGTIAVLFRTNAQSRAFEEALRKNRILYVLVGGTGFYERAEIKDCLAYLRLVVNPFDNVAFERIYNVPGRGLGEKALESIYHLASEKRCSLLSALLNADTESFSARFKKGFADLKELMSMLIDAANRGYPPHELLKDALQISGYMDMLSERQGEDMAGRIENVNELTNALTEWSNNNPGKGLASFLEEVSLVSDVDGWNNREDAVNLMTIHCAKGLEFEHVFLVGCEEGILPSRYMETDEDESKIEEERRLLYVAATRAGRSLACSYANQRYRFGEITPQAPSRFLMDIDTTIYRFEDKSMDFVPKSIRFTMDTGGTGSLRSSRKNRWEFEQTGTTTTREKTTLSKKTDVVDDFLQETVQYRMGQHVRHVKYGSGKILSISGFGADMKLMVLFNSGSRMNLMAKFAKFEHD